MLVLSALHDVLAQILSFPSLHTAILLTREGQLVSTAHDPSRSKDEIRVVVGLCSEVWKQAGEKDGVAMLDSEYGRLLVLPVGERIARTEGSQVEDHQPLMLLALNGSATISWDDLKSAGGALASHLAKPLSRYREYLSPPLSLPATPASPDRRGHVSMTSISSR